MAATAAQALPPVLSRDPGLDTDGSNVSSPLSDVEDKDGDTPDAAAHAGKNVHHHDTGSESNLSEVAEIERLFDAPRHQRQLDFNVVRVFERPPGPFRRAANRAEPAHKEDDELSEPSDVSPPGGTDDYSPVKRPSSRALSSSPPSGTSSKESSRERKRKRSPAENIPRPEQPERKRSESVAAAPAEQKLPAELGDVPMQDDDAAPPPAPSSGEPSVSQSTAELVGAEDVAPGPEVTLRETRGSRKAARNGNKRNATAATDPDTDASHANGDCRRDERVDGEHEPAEADGEEAEPVDKPIEEGKRHAAFEEWTDIDGMFGLFTDRLYKDRLARLEEEERALLADVPYHPEYLSMMRCIDARLQKQLSETEMEHQLQLEAHASTCVAERAQIWGQFFQDMRRLREEKLEDLNDQWYNVQASRRCTHSQPEQVLFFPKDPPQRARNALAYSTEMSSLASLAKYEGFPAAPPIRGASALEAAEDLEAFRRARIQRHPPHTASQPDRFPTPPALGAGLGLAGEQFIKDNAWANPRHPVHKGLPPDGPRPGDNGGGLFLGVNIASSGSHAARPGSPGRHPPDGPSPASRHQQPDPLLHSGGPAHMIKTGPGLSGLVATANSRRHESAKSDTTIIASN